MNPIEPDLPANTRQSFGQTPTSPLSAGSASRSPATTTGPLPNPPTRYDRSGRFPRRSPGAPLSVQF